MLTPFDTPEPRHPSAMQAGRANIRGILVNGIVCWLPVVVLVAAYLWWPR